MVVCFLVEGKKRCHSKFVSVLLVAPIDYLPYASYAKVLKQTFASLMHRSLWRKPH